jgi:hypothetical protein
MRKWIILLYLKNINEQGMEVECVTELFWIWFEYVPQVFMCLELGISVVMLGDGVTFKKQNLVQGN